MLKTSSYQFQIIIYFRFRLQIRHPISDRFLNLILISENPIGNLWVPILCPSMSTVTASQELWFQFHEQRRNSDSNWFRLRIWEIPVPNFNKSMKLMNLGCEFVLNDEPPIYEYWWLINTGWHWWWFSWRNLDDCWRLEEKFWGWTNCYRNFYSYVFDIEGY